jgi:thermitase
MPALALTKRRLALKGGLAWLLTQFLLLMMMLRISAYGGPRNEEPAAFRDGVVLISFRSDILQAQADAILAGVGASELRRIGVGVHVLQVPPGRVSSTIKLLKSLDAIRYAEPDYLQTLAAGALPNDTYIGNQWAIQNNGQSVNGVTGIAGADERLPPAWTVTTGTNAVVVAIVDTGVQYSHPDLLTNMWNNPGGIGGCPAGTHGYNVLTLTCDPMDDDTSYGGHGTHVAGIVGAVANNATGVAGVNWTTSIMAVKWVTSNSVGATSDLITAMDWVVRAKQAGVNVRVMNDSATWPGTGFSQALSDEIDLLGSNDILFVTAAGNTAQNNDTVPRYPCSYNRPNMICVAASDQRDNPWSSSNHGTTTVKLAAPGVNIYSTLRLSNYGYISGTSMASPQVAGTAALILSRGYASVASLITTILNNVDPLPSLSSYVSTGGRLNVCKAVPGCAGALSGTPANSSPPVVSGVPQYGSLVGASAGLWSGSPTQYRYQWYRCASDGTKCSDIQGATSQSYAILAQADIGATLGVAVTASNLSGSATTPSAASAIVSPESSPFSIG